MRTFELIHSLKKYTLLAVLLSCVPQLRAQWIAVVGAQSRDQARQALAFLPNEMWIHADEFLDLSGRGITVDPHNHTTVYFADRGSSIWRSQDAGASWINVDAMPVFSVTVDPTDSNIFCTQARRGRARSRAPMAGHHSARRIAACPACRRASGLRAPARFRWTRTGITSCTSEPRVLACSRVSNFGAAPPGLGQILRVDITD